MEVINNLSYLVAQMVKNSPAVWRPGCIPGWGRPPAEGHCSILMFPWWLRWKRICLQCRRPGFNPWVGKISRRRKWQPTPVFLPGESHGQRNLVGYSPLGHKELDRTEWLSRQEPYNEWTTCYSVTKSTSAETLWIDIWVYYLLFPWDSARSGFLK